MESRNKDAEEEERRMRNGREEERERERPGEWRERDRASASVRLLPNVATTCLPHVPSYSDHSLGLFIIIKHSFYSYTHNEHPSETVQLNDNYRYMLARLSIIDSVKSGSLPVCTSEPGTAPTPPIPTLTAPL